MGYFDGTIQKEINDSIPEFFKDICKEYELEVIKIWHIGSVLMCSKFGIALLIEWDNVDVVYIERHGKKIKYYYCGKYLSSYTGDGLTEGCYLGTKIDYSDIKDISHKKDFENEIKDDLIVIRHLFDDKCKNILRGDLSWKKEFEKSKWYYNYDFSKEETDVIESYFESHREINPEKLKEGKEYVISVSEPWDFVSKEGKNKFRAKHKVVNKKDEEKYYLMEVTSPFKIRVGSQEKEIKNIVLKCNEDDYEHLEVSYINEEDIKDFKESKQIKEKLTKIMVASIKSQVK